MTFIRVQTNSLPDHCFQTNSEMKDQKIDFEVPFNIDVLGTNFVSFINETLYDQHICNSFWPEGPVSLLRNISGDLR
jgi:hypothetical protein